MIEYISLHFVLIICSLELKCIICVDLNSKIHSLVLQKEGKYEFSFKLEDVAC
jgi:hypothetical protein